MNYCGTAEQLIEMNLLSGVLSGDDAAVRSFFCRFNGVIERCVRMVFRCRKDQLSEDDIQDMVSDIWVCLLEDDKKPLRRFDPARRVRVATWISRLARNKAIDHLRTNRDCTIPLETHELLQPTPDQEPLPPEALEDAESRALALRALEKLSSKDRRFLDAWYVERKPAEEIARELGISLSTVYSRRFKIQQRLAKNIRRLLPQPPHPAPGD